MIASSDTAVQLLQSLEAFYMSQKCFNIIFSTGLRLVHESIVETFVKRFGFLPAYHYSMVKIQIISHFLSHLACETVPWDALLCCESHLLQTGKAE